MICSLGPDGPQLLCTDLEETLLEIFHLSVPDRFLFTADFFQPLLISIDYASKAKVSLHCAGLLLITTNSLLPANQKPQILNAEYC